MAMPRLLLSPSTRISATAGDLLDASRAQMIVRKRR
jgi:hypothetical protein